MNRTLSRFVSVLFATSCVLLARGADAQGAPDNIADGTSWRLIGPMRTGWGTAVAGIPDQPNGAASWQQIGLTDTRHIAQILVDPHDAHTSLVAALAEARKGRWASSLSYWAPFVIWGTPVAR